jgi:hypothetical protein
LERIVDIRQALIDAGRGLIDLGFLCSAAAPPPLFSGRSPLDPAMISKESDPGSEISCAGWETRSAVCDEHWVLVSRMVKYTSPTVVVPDVH